MPIGRLLLCRLDRESGGCAERRARAGGQLTSPTSARSSAKIRRASARIVGGVVVGRQRRDEVEVRGDAADGDVAAEEAADRGLEVRPLALGDVLEERLGLREAEGHDVAVDGDRAALGDDRAGGRAGPRRRSPAQRARAGGRGPVGRRAGRRGASAPLAAVPARRRTAGCGAGFGGAVRPARRCRRLGRRRRLGRLAGWALRCRLGWLRGSAGASTRGCWCAARRRRRAAPSWRGRARRSRQRCGCDDRPRMRRRARARAGAGGRRRRRRSGRSPRGVGRRAASATAAGRIDRRRPRALDERGPDRLDRPGRGRRATSRPRSSSPSRTAMPAAASPPTSASTKASTDSASARPSRSRTRGLVEPIAGRRRAAGRASTRRRACRRRRAGR